MRWLVEPGVFGDRYWSEMSAAAASAGHSIEKWSDEWWLDGLPQRDGAVVFHGSLGNAAKVRESGRWRPGAFCDVEKFECSAWYGRAAEWLLHDEYRMVTARELVEDAVTIGLGLGGSRVFVRPDSPLKPFSGRVVDTGAVTLAALDHGFYYDDAELPVVVAPVREIEREWRFVVVRDSVVAGSAYEADGRVASGEMVGEREFGFATEIARRIEPPEGVYVMDLCAVDGALALLELNPFSGASLYGCDLSSVVEAVGRYVEGRQ